MTKERLLEIKAINDYWAKDFADDLNVGICSATHGEITVKDIKELVEIALSSETKLAPPRAGE